MPARKQITDGDRVIEFIEGFCKVPEGSKVGSKIKLADFQKKFIYAIYDNTNTTRRAILSIARKNGKTALIAGLVLAHLVGPMAKQNAQIVSGAMSRDQAALVFNLMAKMIELSPQLSSVCKMVLSAKRVHGLPMNTEYRALAAEGTTAHGLSPVLIILDEIGQVKGASNSFVEAMTTSQGAHENPLLIAISTSAASDADMLSLWIDDATRSGSNTIVCHEYKADEACDILDKAQWKKANPALGLFRSEADLDEQLSQASRLPTAEAAARNLLLNQRISLDKLWLGPTIWRKNGGMPDLDVFRRGEVSMGLDLSQRNDLTAAVIAAKDEDGFVHVLPFVFIPSIGLEDKERRDKAPYFSWVRDGEMYAVGGMSLDYAAIVDVLKVKLEELDIRVTSINFDRWRIDAFKTICEAQNFGMDADWNSVGQGYKDFSPRIEAVENLLLEGKIHHGSHPLLTMAASNGILVVDAAGNKKLDKQKATQKIDPLIAMVMAVYGVSEGQTSEAFDVASWVA